MPFGKLPLSFDHVIASDGLTMQKMLKEVPWLTDILEGVTSIRGGTSWKKKETGRGRVVYHLNVDIGQFTICEFYGKKNSESCLGEKTQ